MGLEAVGAVYETCITSIRGIAPIVVVRKKSSSSSSSSSSSREHCYLNMKCFYCHFHIQILRLLNNLDIYSIMK